MLKLEYTSHVYRFLLIVKVKIEFESIVGPWSELESTALNVEGKVEDVDGARWLENSRRKPKHGTSALYDGHCVTMLLQTLIRTSRKRKVAFYLSF